MIEGVNNAAEHLRLEGFVRGSIDVKGRLKCPNLVRQYLEETGETIFVSTSFDKSTISVFTRTKYLENLNRLENTPGKAAKHVLTFAKKHSKAASVDGQGRILISQELRETLNLASGEVQFELDREHLAVHTETEFKDTYEEVVENYDEKFDEVAELIR